MIRKKSEASGSRARLAFKVEGQGYDRPKTSKLIFVLVENYLSVKQVNCIDTQGKQAVAGSLKIECSVMEYNFVCASCVSEQIRT